MGQATGLRHTGGAAVPVGVAASDRGPVYLGFKIRGRRSPILGVAATYFLPKPTGKGGGAKPPTFSRGFFGGRGPLRLSQIAGFRHLLLKDGLLGGISADILDSLG